MTNESVPVRMWGEKPYRSLDYHLKEEFGEKVYKLSLNGGMTCPNRDGTVGRGGCIFCSAGGSGDFAADRRLSIKEQICMQKEALRGKKPVKTYIAYFQAYTNTYAPVEYLDHIYREAMEDDEVAAVSIGTRPDCLGVEVLDLLGELNQIKPIWVELGLQTIHEKTAQFIRRGYELSCFERAVKELRKRHIDVIVHTILGLPGEERNEILQTMEYLNRCEIQGIKLHLLHILDGTDLGEIYRLQTGEHQERQPFRKRTLEEYGKDGMDEMPQIHILSLEEYMDLVIACLEHLSPDITIHRLTGDGPKELLLAPMWSAKKRTVLNAIHRELKERKTWQGRLFVPQEGET